MKTIPVILAVLGALFLIGRTPVHAGTTVNFGTISEVAGPGDLDLTGNIRYAVAFNQELVGQTVNGVVFVQDSTPPPGFTSTGPQLVTNWQTKPDFGFSADDDALEEIYSDIRWTNQGPGPPPGLDPPLQANMDAIPGTVYRLQVLFYGNHDADRRGWDIQVDGVDAVDNITSLGIDAGAGPPAYSPNIGLVFTYDFTAADNQVNVRFGQLFGGTNEQPDWNAIWSGITLEQLSAPSDTDGDGMADAWEILYFENLAQTAGADPDADGLTNLQEFTNNTDPEDPDSDDDGLNDGPEVSPHMTDPKKADTDGDGLSDGQEVTLGSNPRDSDSDDDNYGDSSEVANSTNPANPASYPLISALATSFTGGDPGEGLDLTGTFPFGFNVGTDGAAPGAVQDVSFTDDSLTPGVVLSTVNQIPDWHNPNYGDTPNDDNLEFVMRSIRWTAAPGTVTLDLTGLIVGKAYKLQLLFAETCCAGRAFDVEVEGRLRVDEFNPAGTQGGANNTTRGAVVTVGFIAADDTLNVVLNGNGITTAAFTDHNPILNAVSLEDLLLPDTDGDTLPDAWEIQYFNNLAGGSGADPDADGRTNAAELLAGTIPNDADTDNDGLNDGGEATLGSSPFVSDSDGDGLTDGEEANTTHTNPLLVDTDGDTFSDGAEYFTGSNPLVAGSLPPIAAGIFNGGDVGDGLDLDGNFLYAFNFGTPGAAGQARDANFTADSAPGITYSAVNEIAAWHAPDYGATANDDVLEFVMQSIRWTPAPGTLGVNLAGLEPGKRYKLQLLFAETGTARGFDVMLEGLNIVDEFYPGVLQEALNTQAAVVSVEFIARDAELNIVLNGNTTGAADKNPILSGATLEALSPAVLEITSVSQTATSLTINARGTPGHTYSVDHSTNLLTWIEATDNLVPNAAGNATWTDTDPLRVGASVRRGFYRLRDPTP